MAKDKKKVPTSRLSRLSILGNLAGRVVGNIAIEGTKQALSGKRPQLAELVLTPNNVKQLAAKLSTMRGAAMKLGQLLSMDGGDLLPDELNQLLIRLQENATQMPHKQLIKELKINWGELWLDHFAHFDLTPFACASIGQVHLAHDDTGAKLAVKVQYPGICKSIDGDIANLGTLIKLTGLIPSEINLNDLLEQARLQLTIEADYQKEASFISLFSDRLDSSIFTLPTVHSLSNRSILVMSFVEGEPIDQLHHLAQHERDNIIYKLFELFFEELFKLKVMQTDPNFANYRYCIKTQKIGLLDFGATREITHEISQGYRFLLSSLANKDVEGAIDAAKQIGFFQSDISDEYKRKIIEIFTLCAYPLYTNEEYDFKKSDIVSRLQAHTASIKKFQEQWHTPPVDALFIHRKIAGLYLLAKKLNASVNVHTLFSKYQS